MARDGFRGSVGCPDSGGHMGRQRAAGMTTSVRQGGKAGDPQGCGVADGWTDQARRASARYRGVKVLEAVEQRHPTQHDHTLGVKSTTNSEGAGRHAAQGMGEHYPTRLLG